MKIADATAATQRLVNILIVKPPADVLLLIARPLLDSAAELIHVAFDLEEIVVGHPGPFLLDFALELIPFALHLILIHSNTPLICMSRGCFVAVKNEGQQQACPSKTRYKIEKI